MTKWSLIIPRIFLGPVPIILIAIFLLLPPTKIYPATISGGDSFEVSKNNISKVSHNIEGNTNISLITKRLDEKISYFFGQKVGFSLGEICFKYSIDEKIYSGLNKSSFTGNLIINSKNNLSLELEKENCYEIKEGVEDYNIKSTISFEYPVYFPPGEYSKEDVANFFKQKSEQGEKILVSYKKADLFLNTLVLLIVWWALCILIFNVIEYWCQGIKTTKK